MEQNHQNMILRMENIVKRFGSLVANDNINLSLSQGEILAVIGENGAGKTTLMKILYGLEAANSGRIFVKGQEVHFKNASEAITSGIGMVQQHFMLFDPFTVAENIVYGKEPKSGLFFDIQKANQQIRELSKKYELPLNPTDKIHGMPVGLRQRVEILKVLYQNADIIIFDEPTAVLTPQEVHELLNTMKQLAAGGKSIIIITHKLNEVMEVADRAMVMRAGKLVADIPIKDTSLADLSFKMVGRKLIEKPVPSIETKQTILEVKDLYLHGEGERPIIDQLSMHVKAGEIVGIAGVSGNGQSELIQCIFGLKSADRGDICVQNVQIFDQPVKKVRQAGVALIPEDRYIWGSANQATIQETGIMGHYQKPQFSTHGILKIKAIQKFAADLVRKFNVKTDSIQQKTSSLSGGNAQKLIVAREMMQKTPLLIACEPTRGVDIGAMEFIHAQIVEKRDSGDAVLLVSSELTEIMKLSDRIYVIYDGKITGEFQRGKATEEELGFLMAGGHHGDK